MNFWIRVFATFFLSLMLLLALPWWAVAIASFIVGTTTKRKGFTSFLSGFLGVLLLWMGYAGYIDVSTKSILTEKVAAIFQLQSGLILIVITGLIGGLVGGFSALSGTQFRKLFVQKSTTYYQS